MCLSTFSFYCGLGRQPFQAGLERIPRQEKTSYEQELASSSTLLDADVQWDFCWSRSRRSTPFHTLFFQLFEPTALWAQWAVCTAVPRKNWLDFKLSGSRLIVSHRPTRSNTLLLVSEVAVLYPQPVTVSLRAWAEHFLVQAEISTRCAYAVKSSLRTPSNSPPITKLATWPNQTLYSFLAPWILWTTARNISVNLEIWS